MKAPGRCYSIAPLTHLDVVVKLADCPETVNVPDKNMAILPHRTSAMLGHRNGGQALPMVHTASGTYRKQPAKSNKLRTHGGYSDMS